MMVAGPSSRPGDSSTVNRTTNATTTTCLREWVMSIHRGPTNDLNLGDLSGRLLQARPCLDRAQNAYLRASMNMTFKAS